METLLINEKLFRENSPIKEDTIISKFVPYVEAAQLLYIERVLGRPLTDELKEQIKENKITPANSALILKIAPALSLYTVYQGLPFHWATIVNKGLTIRESENSKGVDLQELSQLRRWIKDDAEVFRNDLISYLCECRTRYPLWRPGNGCGCADEEHGSATQLIDTGIYIPEKYRR